MIYRIDNIEFDKELFHRVRKDLLSAEEVFALTNKEQQKIAYQFMDKSKMQALKNFAVLEEKVDNQGNVMKVIEFNIGGFPKPFKFLQCVCPTKGETYFLETLQDSCDKAKARSFGKDKLNFDKEY